MKNQKSQINDNIDFKFIELVLSAYKEAIKECNPSNSILQNLHYSNNILFFSDTEYNLDSFERLYVIGAGKAAYKMAESTFNLLVERIDEGCICIPLNSHINDNHIGKIKIIHSSHPTPNEDSVLGAQIISEIAKKANEKDLILFLLSGGASSLMCMPEFCINLEEKQIVNNVLLKSGASISEINIVRKEISAIKGGKLAKLAFPAKVIQIVISDVIGNSLETIGSGPMIQNRTNIIDAVNILNKYNLFDYIPKSVNNFLLSQLHIRENQKYEENQISDNSIIYDNITTKIITDNKVAISSAGKSLEENKIKVYYYPEPLINETSKVAMELFNYIENLSKINPNIFAVVTGGEPVVKFNKNLLLNKDIKGGRSQEVALYMLKNIEKCQKRKIFFLAAGTDGIDGPTDAAGAIVSNNTLKLSQKLCLNIDDFLNNHNSYNYFNQTDALIRIGYSDTNVNDIFIAIVV